MIHSNFKNFNDSIDNYLIPFTELTQLKNYLKFIYRDLKSKSKFLEKKTGISKAIFAGYFNLPMSISDKIFEAFVNSDDKKDYLAEKKFVNGMIDLYSGDYRKIVPIIFRIISSNNKEKKVFKNDIELFLAYITDYPQILEDANDLIQIFFNNSEFLNYDEFKEKIAKGNSDVFTIIYFFLVKKKPFHSEIFESLSNIVGHDCDSKLKKSKTNVCESTLKSTEIKRIAEDFTNSIEDIFAPSYEFQEFLKNYFGIKCKTTKINRKMGNKNLKIQSLDYYDKELKIQNKKTSVKVINKSEINCKKNDEEIISPCRNLYKTFDHFSEGGFKTNDTIQLSYIENDTNEFSRDLNNKENKRFNGDKIKFLSIDNSQNYKSGEDRNTLFIEKNIENLENICYSDKIQSYPFKLLNDNLLKSKLIIIQNDLFEFISKSYSSEEYSLNSIKHLTGYSAICCKVTEIDNKQFYPLAFTTQYGNNMANLKNIYFFPNENDREYFYKVISKILNIRDLNDDYDLILHIGKGHFGRVALGINKHTKSKVAVKSIEKEKLTEKVYEYVRREIDILRFVSKFQNKNIIRLIDVYEDRSKIHIITEYMAGGNLSTYINSKIKVMTQEIILFYLNQIVNGIKFLHKYGIVHRDIKLENILLSDKSLESNLKIIDFGLSKVLGQFEKTNECVGTIVFSAPEVILGSDYDHFIDIWSLGIMLFYIFTGKLPFNHKGRCEKTIAKKICDKEPKFSKLQCCEQLVSIIKSCLNKLPNKRPKIEEIEKILQNRLI